MDKLLTERYYHQESRLKATELVRLFIIENALILTGGLVIDYTLRLSGKKIYEDYVVPDYDFFSTDNVKSASDLLKLLVSQGFTNVSMLTGIHPSTIRVYVFKDVIADITYLPQDIFRDFRKSALIYNDMMFRNPLIQCCDQHRALSYPYESEPRETINNRWAKDFERFCKLMKYTKPEMRLRFQNAIAGKAAKLEPASCNVAKELDTKHIIAGDFALLYYTDANFKFAHKSGSVKYTGFETQATYLMDDEDRAAHMLKYGAKLKGIQRYKPYLEWLPERYESSDIRILCCAHKTGFQNIAGEVKIVCANFALMYAYSMWRITKNNNYGYYYLALLDRLYSVYSDKNKVADKLLFPSIVTYGSEKPTIIEQYMANNPDAKAVKITPVYISNGILPELPYDFKYIDEIYIQDGSKVE